MNQFVTTKGDTEFMQHTINDVLYTITLNYLETIDKSNPPSPDKIEVDLLSAIQQTFEQENVSQPKGAKWKIPLRLDFTQIAYIMAALYPICRIQTAGESADSAYDLLAVYQTDGPDAGIYVTSDETFRRIARQYNKSITNREFNEAMIVLGDIVPRKERCHRRHLIAVNNGIFNYDTKQLLPFTPDLVFMSKSKVNYNPNATNVVIHNPEDGSDWDVESWMNDLSDDPEIVNTLWEILGAIIRPNVKWDKSAWLYSETGNNGKGTLCELMRQLCGRGSSASIPLADMGKDFLLEPLTRANAIIVDENDVGTYIDKAANLKAIITNDVIQINRKFKTPIPYRFYGFMVQCLNEFPRIKDKSDSFYRRQLFIPFDKCFTGKERKYIKHDYLHRPEVLEYVLYKVLNMNYYVLSTPAACTAILEEYREFNDPVRQFIDEILPCCVWDMLPFTFLYDLYQSWYKKNIPSGGMQSKGTFISDLIAALANNQTWYCEGKKKQYRLHKSMSKPEPLIAEYNLVNWYNPQFKDSCDINKKCLYVFDSNARYRGILRYQHTQPTSTP